MEELQDLGVLDTCANCSGEMDGGTWFWYADAGSVHLTFHQDCCPDHQNFKRVERATAVRLTDDRTGERFVRLLAIPDDWF